MLQEERGRGVRCEDSVARQNPQAATSRFLLRMFWTETHRLFLHQRQNNGMFASPQPAPDFLTKRGHMVEAREEKKLTKFVATQSWQVNAADNLIRDPTQNTIRVEVPLRFSVTFQPIADLGAG